jgi:hypothetical protein
MSSVEDFIDKENTVRFVDAFVVQLEFDKLCFHTENTKREEKPTVFEIKKTHFKLKSHCLKMTFQLKI